jgi:transcriptional regulator with XRE-family HTH domain
MDGGLRMDKEQIGLKIKNLRRKKGWSQYDLARRLKIDRSTLSKIETGDIAPTARILIELKLLFSTSIDWLLTDSSPGELNESGDTEVGELLTAIRENPGVRHAILSFFYQYKAGHPELFANPGTFQLDNSYQG